MRNDEDRSARGGRTCDGGSAFRQLAAYRDGAVVVGHWAGRSEWERHTVGDEIVMVVEGSTTISFLDGDGALTGCAR